MTNETEARVWVVTSTYVPRVRVAWGKRTHAHVFYKVFTTREEAMVVYKHETGRPYNDLKTRISQERAVFWPAKEMSTLESAWIDKRAVDKRRAAAAKKRIEALRAAAIAKRNAS